MAGYNDNNAVYGSQKVSAGGTSFVAKNIKVDVYDANRGTSTDEKGNEDKQWFMTKIPLGTLTLQFPTPTTAAPAQFTKLPLTPVGASTAVSWILYKLGETYEVAGETLMDCSIAKEMATSSGTGS